MNESNYLHFFPLKQDFLEPLPKRRRCTMCEQSWECLECGLTMKNRTSWNPYQREEDVPILQTKLVREILHHLHCL